MKKYSIPNFVIALFIVSSSHAQLIEPEFVQIFQEYSREHVDMMPRITFHDIKVGEDNNVYVADNTGIYLFNQDDRSFTLLWTDELLKDFQSGYSNMTITQNGEIIIFDAFDELKIITDNQMDTLPLYYENSEEDAIGGFNAIAANDLNQIFFTAVIPFFPVEDRKLVILVRDKNGNVELVAGGGNQKITKVPQNRFDVKLDNGFKDLFLFKDGTIIFGWQEQEDVNVSIPNINNLDIITPDGQITKHMSYLSEKTGRTFATKDHLFFNASNALIKYLHPALSEPISLSRIPSTKDRSVVGSLYMDYSPMDDTLYVIAHETERFVLWKVPNVLSTLQSHVKGWEIYE